MSEPPPEEYVTKHCQEERLNPLLAYARLRHYAPDRHSFLLESRAKDTPAGRYSIIGYRARSAEMLPPGIDAVAAMAEELEPMARPDGYPEALARGRFGYFSGGVALTMNQVPVWDDELASAYFFRGLTVALFDHVFGDIFVCGPRKGNVVERCWWEMTHGDVEPEPTLPAEPPVLPEKLLTDPSPEKLAAKVARAKAFLSPEQPSLNLAVTYRSPIADADPLDVFRTLRGTVPESHMFFLHAPVSPVVPPMQIIGSSETAVHYRRRDDEKEEESGLYAACRQILPHESTTGAGGAAALRLIRRLEDSSRGLLGGLIGYLCPGGEAAFVHADRIIVASDGYFTHKVAVPLLPDGDLSEAALTLAKPGLIAIRTAQDAANAPRPAASPAEDSETPSPGS